MQFGWQNKDSALHSFGLYSHICALAQKKAESFHCGLFVQFAK